MKKEPKNEIEVNLSKQRDEKLAPIAREILLALSAREDLVMGSGESITTEQAADYYRDKYIDVVIPILIREDVRIADIDYLFQLMSQPINFIKDITTASFYMNRSIADAMLYGVDDINDLKVSELDEILKRDSKDKK